MIDVRLGNSFVQTVEIILGLWSNAEIGRLDQKHNQHKKRHNQLIENSVMLNLTQPLEARQPTELLVAKQLVCRTRRSLSQPGGRGVSHLIERFKFGRMSCHAI